MRPGAVLGIDPGVNGGISVISVMGSVLYLRSFYPDMKAQEAAAVVNDAVQVLRGYDSRVCFMEKVGYLPTDGGKGAFTFGRVVGILEGSLYSLGLEPAFVPPMVWQAKLNCMSGGNKNVTKKRAQDIFPKVRMTHAIADALLISEFGRLRILDGSYDF